MRAKFVLAPVGALHAHEEVEADDVRALVELLRSQGVVSEPIWVAEGYDVILNGHHRYAAVQRLGARVVPAWALEYFTPDVRLERWGPGPPISKEEVVERARSGRLFPPKTTRHSVEFDLPPRPTRLDLLFANGGHPRGRRPSLDDGRSSDGA